MVIDKFIHSFLQFVNPLEKKQIISFGAGSDTRYFNIMVAFLFFKNIIEVNKVNFRQICKLYFS